MSMLTYILWLILIKNLVWQSGQWRELLGAVNIWCDLHFKYLCTLWPLFCGLMLMKFRKNLQLYLKEQLPYLIVVYNIIYISTFLVPRYIITLCLSDLSILLALDYIFFDNNMKCRYITIVRCQNSHNSVRVKHNKSMERI